jgi:hypothetical protein
MKANSQLPDYGGRMLESHGGAVVFGHELGHALTYETDEDEGA